MKVKLPPLHHLFTRTTVSGKKFAAEEPTFNFVWTGTGTHLFMIGCNNRAIEREPPTQNRFDLAHAETAGYPAIERYLLETYGKDVELNFKPELGDYRSKDGQLTIYYRLNMTIIVVEGDYEAV